MCYNRYVYIKKGRITIMKHKTLLAVTSLLLAGTLLASCSSSNKISFKNYWFKDAEVPQGTTETLVYDVAFEEGSGLADDSYALAYTNGTYQTTFSLAEKDGVKIYRYETQFSIDVTYSYGSESETFSDYVKSWVEFERSANLRPIASHKEYVSHSPVSGATSVADSYTKYHYSVDTTYASGAQSGQAVVTNLETQAAQTDSFEYEDKYTYLDNEQLLLAVRGLYQSASTSNPFYCYDYGKKSVQIVNAAFGSKQEGATFAFSKNGSAYNGVVDYFPLELSLDAENPGATQTLWLAETEDSRDNTFRNVIVKMETPLSYNLGSLVYTLKSAEFFA